MLVTWRDLGLPYPNSSGFGYSVALGLQRTPFPTEHPRQAKTTSVSPKSFSLVFHLTGEQLVLAEGLLTSRGYSGFSLRLPGRPCPHPIGLRLTDKYTVAALASDYFSLTISVEEAEACDAYREMFDELVFQDLPTYDLTAISSLEESCGVLNDPWETFWSA